MKASAWLVVATGIVVLLIAAMSREKSETFSGVNVQINGVDDHHFMDKSDVIKILESVNGGKLDKVAVSSMNLSAMEKALAKDKWVKKVDLFFDNSNHLQVSIDEREPIARIFTTSGNSFYLDSGLVRLPLINKFSARLPVFTNFPTDVIVLNKKDSSLLKEIRLLSGVITNDPFWMAQIDQIDITPYNTFEMIPKLGNQIIRFGSADKYQEKFNNLLAFYKKVQKRTGWNRYSVVDVQFANQVVAVKRDAKEVKADSVRAVQIMKDIIAEAKRKMNDSTNVQLDQDNNPIDIRSSREIDNIPDENTGVSVEKPSNVVAPPAPVVKPAAKKPTVVAKPTSTVTKPKITIPAKKPAAKKPEVKKAPVKTVPKVKQQPKAVMPKKTDQ